MKRYSTNTHDLKDKNVYCSVHAPRNNQTYLVIREPKYEFQSKINESAIMNDHNRDKDAGIGQIKLSIYYSNDKKILSVIVYEARYQ